MTEHVIVRRGAYYDSVTLMLVSRRRGGVGRHGDAAQPRAARRPGLHDRGGRRPQRPRDRRAGRRRRRGGRGRRPRAVGQGAGVIGPGRAARGALARLGRAPRPRAQPRVPLDPRRPRRARGGHRARGRACTCSASRTASASRTRRALKRQAPRRAGCCSWAPTAAPRSSTASRSASRTRCSAGRSASSARPAPGSRRSACLLDAAGVGISHAIGVGGRDLSARGRRADDAARARAAGRRRRHRGRSSRSPSRRTRRWRTRSRRRRRRPASRSSSASADDVARRAPPVPPSSRAASMPELGAALRRPPTPGDVRGLYSGGTLCGEAAAIVGRGTFTDFGADEFTQGRAHPMIDQSLRLEHLAAAARDPGVTVVLLDVVLGFGAHPDPAGELAPAIEARRQARDRRAVRRGRRPPGPRRPARAARGRRRGRHAQQRARRAAGLRRQESAPRGGVQLLGRPLAVANAGVDLFADELERQGVRGRARRVAPAGARHRGGARAAGARGRGDRARQRRGGRAARGRAADAGGRRHARETCSPDMADRTILHAGPPIEWADMSGPLRGAVIGAAVYEGLAEDREDAERKAAAGAFEFGPCHERGAVGPDGGRGQRLDADVSSSRTRRTATARSARSTRASARSCATAPTTTRCWSGCAWIRDVLARVFGRALARLGEPVDLRATTAQALQMGDEGHNRNRAGTSLLLRTLLPALIELDEPLGRRRRGRAIHRGQRPLLPELHDAGLEGDGRRGRRDRAVLDRRRHGAQRDRVRRAAERDRRPLVHGAERR